jgi:hypothetical protein
MEAKNAVDVFNSNKDDLHNFLRSSISGRQLIAREFDGDVELASELDSEVEVAVWIPKNEIREFEPFSGVDLERL